MKTDQEIIDLIIGGATRRQLKKEHGVNNYRHSKLYAMAARQGFSPDHDMTHTVPDGYHVKGTSTLYKDGKPALQWVKSSIDHERQREMMVEAAHALVADIPKYDASPLVSRDYADLMAVYPIADAHIGMMSWGEETGEDWDMKIAEEKILGVFDRLVRTAPNCKQAVIVNLGDWFHSENMEGRTSKSGHSLDMDSRFGKMIDVGVKMIRVMIDSALQHHETVRVVGVKGNHDETASIVMHVMLAMVYENEPRVIIDREFSVFAYFRFGEVLCGVHHGHTCKADKLMGVMATDRAKEWGQTKHRHWLTGHIHHDSRKEYSGCTVESFRTLIARDSYAADNGYRSQRDSKCIVYHKQYGEVERHTVNIDMVA